MVEITLQTQLLEVYNILYIRHIHYSYAHTKAEDKVHTLFLTTLLTEWNSMGQNKMNISFLCNVNDIDDKFHYLFSYHLLQVNIESIDIIKLRYIMSDNDSVKLNQLCCKFISLIQIRLPYSSLIFSKQLTLILHHLYSAWILILKYMLKQKTSEYSNKCISSQKNGLFPTTCKMLHR